MGGRGICKGKKGVTWESDANTEMPSLLWVVTTKRGGGSRAAIWFVRDSNRFWEKCVMLNLDSDWGFEPKLKT